MSNQEKIGSDFNDFFKEEFLPEEQNRMLNEAQKKIKDFLKKFEKMHLKNKG